MSKVQSTEDLMKLALEDPKYLIESYFSIVNKNKEVVPFIFNRLQNEFYEDMTAYDDILKPGQIGFSTMILAIETVKFLLVPNSWSVSLSYESEASARLFQKVDFFLDTLPPILKPYLKLSVDSRRVLHNEIMNSQFYIGTQGAIAFGRGDTIHYAHLSEISRWKDQGRIATGILRAVPDSKTKGDIWIVKETTANGQGNYHHTEWKREKAGKSIFKPHFFPWFKHDEYKVEGVKIPPESLTEDERHLLKRYPKWVDDARIAWRRKKIDTLSSEKGYTPEDIFKQEFPSDDREAFLFSGNPIFPPKPVEEMVDTATDPIVVGNIVGMPPTQTLDENPKGYVKIWELPEADGYYIIFADVGQFSDFCSAHVVDGRTWSVVATFHANIQSHSFGDELNVLGHFYNKALIAVEINNMGQSTADRLVDLKYPHLYMRQRLDKKTKKKTDVVGWHTSERTKSLMIGHMQDMVRRYHDGMIPDIETLGEMQTFVKTDTGKMQASEGNNDDRVISCSGAFFILKLHPFRPPKKDSESKTVREVHKYKKLRTRAGKGRFGLRR